MKKFAEIILTLKDEASKGIQTLGNAFMGLTKILSSVGAGLMACFVEYGKQEEAVNKLDVAMKNSGMATQGSTQRLTELANQLQKTTKFADDTSVSAMGLLGTFGLNEQSITKLLPKIQDMASALDIDLQTAAMTAGKAISSGQIGMLTRYGVVLDETKFKTDPVVAVTEALTEKFNGQAEAVAQGPIGAIARLKNQYSDLMETIGQIIAGPMSEFINKLSEMAMALMENQTTIQLLTDVFFAFGETLMSLFTFIGEMIGTFVAGVVSNIEIIQMAITGNFAGAIEQFKAINSAAATSVKTSWNNMVATIKDSFSKINNERQVDLKNDNTAKKQEQKQQTEHFAWMEKTQTEFDAKAKKTTEEKIKTDMERRKIDNTNKITDLTSTLGTISTLTQSHEKSLFAVGKAAAIANAIINIAQGVTKALSLGPIAGPIGAALVAAAGAVQIHTIGATSMAEGGIVMPTATGTLARVAEAGYPEAIIPLDDDRAGGILGNNITVNINAGVVVADDNSLREFAEMIDEKLYELNKNNQTVSI